MSEFARRVAHRALHNCGKYASDAHILDTIEDAVWRACSSERGVDLKSYDILRADVVSEIHDARARIYEDVHERGPDFEAEARWNAGARDRATAERVVYSRGGIYGSAKGRKHLRSVISGMGLRALSDEAVLQMAALHTDATIDDDIPF